MLVVTFTTIPPRFNDLGGFLSGLAAQKTRPDRVELYVAQNYRRFPGERPALPPLPEWVNVIEVEHDLGPATKVLPAARTYAGQDVDILYCDDDRVYDPGWVGRFQQARKDHPTKAIAEQGLHIEECGTFPRRTPPQPRAIRQPKIRFYRAIRWLSLGTIRPVRPSFSAAGYIDIAEGYGGVMVRPDFFGPKAWDIPDVMWTVDDVWLSGQMQLQGHDVWLNHLAPPRRRNAGVGKVSALADHVEDGVGRGDANRMTIDYFRDTYDIWT